MMNDKTDESAVDSKGEASDFERLVMLPPYVEPEHRHLIESAELALEQYSDMLMGRIKKELFDHGWSIDPSSEDIRKAERNFHEDPVRIMLIKSLGNIKTLCERPRFLIKPFLET